MPAQANPQLSHKPNLDRIALIKSVLQSFRIRLDEELQPLGVTTAQLRLLWAIAENPQASGSQLARLVSVTPQTGQATLARLEEHGWVLRRSSDRSDRVLTAQLTDSGKRLLKKARETAEAVNDMIWRDIPKRDLKAMESSLRSALGELSKS